MIEVEKKFLLSDADKERLTEGAEFISEKTFTDSYFDTPDYALTSKDKWLRMRDGRYELKLPLHMGAERVTDQYDELEDEDSIRKALGWESGESFAEDLVSHGYAPFATITTTRKKYRQGEFIIDLDDIDFGNSTYTIGEVEILIEDRDGVNAAADRIIEFAKENGLTIAPVRGKIIEYLKRNNPAHHQALVDAGAIQDI